MRRLGQLLAAWGLLLSLGILALPVPHVIAAAQPSGTFEPGKPLPLLTVLQNLAEEYHYQLVTDPLLVRAQQVPVPARGTTMESRLGALLSPFGLRYDLIERTLVVYREKAAIPRKDEPHPYSGYSGAIAEVEVNARALAPTQADSLGYGGERYMGGADASINFREMRSQGITDLASAFELISGVKMEQNRYAVIRGLRGRYQSVRLNGAVLPSLEPSSQRVPMDIFPVEILSHVDLYKSVFADAPGNASAGVVNIETRGISTENTLNLIAGSAYTGGTTGQAVLRGYTGDRDWLGSLDPQRKLPTAIAGDAHYGNLDHWPEAEREAAGESIPTHYALTKGTAGVDGLLSLSGTYHWQQGDHHWGVSASLGYENRWRQVDQQSRVMSRRNLVSANDELKEVYLASETSQHRRLDNQINANTLVAFAYSWRDTQHIGANYLLLRQSSLYSEQIKTQKPGSSYFYAEPERLRSLHHWTGKQVWLGQFYGSHLIDSSALWDLQWHLTSASSRYLRPYEVDFQYLRPAPSLSYHFDTSSSGFQVSWEQMQEESFSSGISAVRDWSLDTLSGDIKVGYELLNGLQDGYLLEYIFTPKGDIDSSWKLLERNDPAEILTPGNIIGKPGTNGFLLNDPIHINVNPAALDGNFYWAKRRNRAHYLLANSYWNEHWAFLLGVRRERETVKADFWDRAPQGWVPLLDEGHNLYSAALNYIPSGLHNLRLGYSETVVWPSVNELMPKRYEDVDLRIHVTGNPYLQIAQVRNWDLRWTYNNRDRDFEVNFLAFHKDIDNAIEGVFFDPVRRADAVFNVYSYINTRAAKLYGCELEMDYSRVMGNTHQFTLGASYSHMYSKVEIPEDLETQTGKRPLQGQPKHLVNLHLQYNHLPSEQRLSLRYKHSGRELFIVSDTRDVPHVYRNSSNNLSLSYSLRFMPNLHGVISVENLLQDEHRYKQAGQLFMGYKENRKFRLRISADF
ncbi:TonB-dependent receptor plug domain-containing protein [Microbulbifer sp. 2205BS26-8]|uniref:TonB-dependent receptor plug domain-containing protein n=1 Tax=Microbulbifer sp. 2205BS26-8 TaxID=3064386 RepID=UPI00273E365C|nr:TonB-dependent receptor plug domain-containing protein [Microbulbifer sp. 2205BS26-8]MDP5210169.1 TonB-dependent receptor plug domain-containing protein [Microbulbifer sp. 2205BS26-8]